MLCSVILWFINYFDIKRLFIEIVSTNSCAVGISSPKELRNCFARTHIFGSLQHAEISFAIKILFGSYPIFYSAASI
jgi:hypothetical protein